MKWIETARSILMLISIMILVVPVNPANATTTFSENEKEFIKGDKFKVYLDESINKLMINNSIPKDWIRTQPGSPYYARMWPGFFYDSNRDRFVLFGGFTEKVLMKPNNPGQFAGWFINDTWEYFPDNDTWFQLDSSISLEWWGTSGVGARPFVFDYRHNVGISIAPESNDIWYFNCTKNTLTKTTTYSGPASSRDASPAAYCSNSDELILLTQSSSDWLKSETWTFNVSSNSWRNREPICSPPWRRAYTAAYDSRNNVVVLWGGYTPNPNEDIASNDTWVYDIDMNRWTQINSSLVPENNDTSWKSYNMIYDQSAGECILIIRNETWVFNVTTGSWKYKSKNICPWRYDPYSIAYDQKEGNVAVFGSGPNIWSYNSSTDSWTESPSPQAPGNGVGALMGFDEKSNRVVLFGGCYDEPDGHPFASCYGMEKNETWTYDIVNNTWSKRKTKISPSPRDSSAFAFDSLRDKFILCGGEDENGEGLSDTWSFDAGTDEWEPLAPAPVILETGWPNFTRMVYDEKIDAMVLFASQDQAVFHYYPGNDTWTEATKQNEFPTRWWEPDVVFDKSEGVIVCLDSIEDKISIYNASNGTWTESGPGQSPFCIGSGVIYDEENNVILRINNSDGSLWAFRTSSKTWMRISEGENLLARNPEGFVYGTTFDALVVFGGELYPPPDYGWGSNSTPYSSDTWVYGLQPREPNGTYTSQPIDLGGSAFFGNISWQASTPPNTELALQIRTADSSETLRTSYYVGSDGSAASFYKNSGQRIHQIHNGSQWLQYRAYFKTNNPFRTPTLSSIHFNYNLIQNVALTSPITGDNWFGIHNITWCASDPDNDSLTFDIFLESSTGSVPLASNLSNGAITWSWDTGIVPNGTYRIRISANDYDPSIPLTVNITSGNFTIYHLPPQPNHPPTVTLLSPTNNSIIDYTSVRLSWHATDPDADSLTYAIRYSDRSLHLGTFTVKQASAEYLDLANLSDNTTYYWTVDANDGTNNHTAIPADIWTFTIRLPPINHPPRITSTPPSIIQVGELYLYNITAIDEEITSLRFSLLRAPDNMSLDNITGRLCWTPADSDIGNHTITVQVSDGRGGSDDQTFTVTVSQKPIPPIPDKPLCMIVYPLNGSKVGGHIQIRGTAIKGILPLKIIQIRIDDGNWMNAIGLENWTLTVNSGKMKNGHHSIEARAFDGSLYSETASVDVLIANPEPHVSIGVNQWCLPVIIVIVVVGIGGLFLLRKNRRKSK